MSGVTVRVIVRGLICPGSVVNRSPVDTTINKEVVWLHIHHPYSEDHNTFLIRHSAGHLLEAAHHYLQKSMELFPKHLLLLDLCRNSIGLENPKGDRHC